MSLLSSIFRALPDNNPILARYTRSTGTTANVRYEVADFFAMTEQFDVVYDYT